VIAKSGQLRDRILAMGVNPEKTCVVANGCDGNIFFVRDRDSARRELNIPQSAELIAFVGRVHTRKGIGELLDAVAALLRTRPHLRMVCVGDGPSLTEMQERAHTSNLVDRVDFPGACSPSDVARWLAAANLLALPSYAEGCPNVVIEALSCGRPIVATRVGSIPELVDPSCGVLVPLGDPAALTQALDRALNTQWDEAAIAKRFRRSWQQVAQEVLAVCQSSWSDARA